MSRFVKRLLGFAVISLFLFAAYQNCAPSNQGSFSSTGGGPAPTNTGAGCWDCYPELPPNNGTPACVHEVYNTRTTTRINPSTNLPETTRDYVPSDSRLTEAVFAPVRNLSLMRTAIRTNFALDSSVEIYENRIDHNFLNTQETAALSRHRLTEASFFSSASTATSREIRFTLDTRTPAATGALLQASGTFTRWYSFVRFGEEICSTPRATFRIVPSCGLRLTHPPANRCYNGTQGSAGIELTVETQFAPQPVSNNFPLVWYRAATSSSSAAFTSAPVMVNTTFVSGNQYRHSHGPTTNVIGGFFRLWYDQVDPRTGEILCRSDFVDYTVAQSCN
jgi:hypothetical protein